jgi:hypothetical protein
VFWYGFEIKYPKKNVSWTASKTADITGISRASVFIE